MVYRKHTKGRKVSKRHTKSHKVSKRNNKSRKASNKRIKHTRRHNKKSMRGGMRSLQPADIDAPVEGPVFVPKGVSYLPSGGGASTGIANGSKYYDLAQNTQKGGGLIPEPLVQLGRSISYNIQHMYDTYQGQPTYISKNPDVLKQRIPVPQEYEIQPIDVHGIEESAITRAANFKPYGI